MFKKEKLLFLSTAFVILLGCSCAIAGKARIELIQAPETPKLIKPDHYPAALSNDIINWANTEAIDLGKALDSLCNGEMFSDDEHTISGKYNIDTESLTAEITVNSKGVTGTIKLATVSTADGNVVVITQAERSMSGNDETTSFSFSEKANITAPSGNPLEGSVTTTLSIKETDKKAKTSYVYDLKTEYTYQIARVGNFPSIHSGSLKEYQVISVKYSGPQPSMFRYMPSGVPEELQSRMSREAGNHECEMVPLSSSDLIKSLTQDITFAKGKSKKIEMNVTIDQKVPVGPNLTKFWRTSPKSTEKFEFVNGNLDAYKGTFSYAVKFDGRPQICADLEVIWPEK